jgi:hypothetical protein
VTPEELAILRAIALITELLNLVQGTQSDAETHARETSQYRIQSRVDNIDFIATDPVYGFMGIIDAIAGVRIDNASPHLATLTDVLDAIAAIPQFTLPETPPPGYGGGEGVSPWLSNLETYDWCPVD